MSTNEGNSSGGLALDPPPAAKPKRARKAKAEPQSENTSSRGSREPVSLPDTSETRLSPSEKLSAVGALIAGEDPETEEAPVIEPVSEELDPENGAVQDPEDEGAAQESGATSDPESNDLAQDQDADGDADEDLPAAVSFDMLAEALGVERKDLYAIEVPMGGNGEVMTLGEVKHLALDHRRNEQERVQWEERRDTERTELVTAQNEMAQLVGQIAPYLPPELLAEFRAKGVAEAERERGKILQAFPEWKDAETYQHARGEMVALVGEFGFSPAELSSLVDHRIVNMLMAFSNLRKRMDRITNRKPKLRQARKGGKPGRRVSAADAQRATIERGRSGGQTDKVKAVSAILRSAK